MWTTADYAARDARRWRVKMRLMSKYEAARTQLEDQLVRLLQRVGKIEGDLRRAHDRDWQEQSLEVENDEVLSGLDEMTLAEVRHIRAALQRIANGTYGVCATCGRPIGAQRLAAVPTAVTCIVCSTGPRP
jgi:RNA polymerase-binding transcription factor DksA